MPSGYKKCPRCGEEVRDYVERCSCGWRFYKKECPRCGKIVPDSVKICYDCGWYFYWDEEIGEDDYDEYTNEDTDEDIYQEDYYLSYWSEVLDEDFENEQQLGEYLDDLGYGDSTSGDD